MTHASGAYDTSTKFIGGGEMKESRFSYIQYFRSLFDLSGSSDSALLRGENEMTRAFYIFLVWVLCFALVGVASAKILFEDDFEGQVLGDEPKGWKCDS